MHRMQKINTPCHPLMHKHTYITRHWDNTVSQKVAPSLHIALHTHTHTHTDKRKLNTSAHGQEHPFCLLTSRLPISVYLTECHVSPTLSLSNSHLSTGKHSWASAFLSIVSLSLPLTAVPFDISISLSVALPWWYTAVNVRGTKPSFYKEPLSLQQSFRYVTSVLITQHKRVYYKEQWALFNRAKGLVITCLDTHL